MSLTSGQRATLIQVAKDAIQHGLKERTAPEIAAQGYEPALREQRASFVTLTIEGRLRGCIGALEAARPLVRDVSLHAYSAAFRDPRFPPVDHADASQLHIHISILSLPTPIQFRSEAELCALLRPGSDGLIIALGSRRATFLPSVWETLPDPKEFLSRLKMKGDFPQDAEHYEAWRYTTESFP